MRDKKFFEKIFNVPRAKPVCCTTKYMSREKAFFVCSADQAARQIWRAVSANQFITASHSIHLKDECLLVRWMPKLALR